MQNNYIVNMGEYNTKLAGTCRSGISFDSGKFGKNQEIQEKKYIEDCKNELFKYIKSEKEIDFYNKTMDYFIKKYIEKLNEMNQAQSGCISSMITGPARFKPNTKANSSYEKRVEEIIGIFGKTKAYFLKNLKKLRTKEAGGEVEEKKQKLAEMEKQQENMKAINKICMSIKKSNDEKITECKELGISDGILNEIIEQLKENNFEKVKLFPSYSLTNFNARIKGIKNFLARQEKIANKIEESGATSKIADFGGGEIIKDLESQRINIIFDGKPEQKIIDIVKSHGFKWSWKFKTWTRKLTNNAIWTTERMLKAQGE